MSRIRLAATLLALTLLALPAFADTFITTKTDSEGLAAMGQAGGPGETTTWVGSNRFRTDDGSTSTIVNLDAGRLYLVDHGSESFSTIELPIDFAKLLPPEMAGMMEQMAGQMKMDVTITPTDETREVGGFSTKKYEIEVQNSMGMKIDVQQWVTTDVELDTGSYKKMMIEMAAMQPMMADMARKMTEVEGFPVLTETSFSMMGQEMKSREEVVSIEEKSAPEGTYAPPAGYAEKPFEPAAMMGG